MSSGPSTIFKLLSQKLFSEKTSSLWMRLGLMLVLLPQYLLLLVPAIWTKLHLNMGLGLKWWSDPKIVRPNLHLQTKGSPDPAGFLIFS